MSSPSLPSTIKNLALEAGLGPVGITTAAPFAEAERAMVARVQAGHLAGMDWFTVERARISCRPQELLAWARSIVVVAVPYLSAEASSPRPADQPRGSVSRYAWGTDYHLVLKPRLQRLADLLRVEVGGQLDSRSLVDTGRLAERAAAQRAGVGWTGRSANLIVHPYGTWVFLGALVTNLDLEPDPPATGSCGRCDRCLRSCPTGALLAPYTVDARRCLSYLTIEHRGPIPAPWRPLLGPRLFGCDVCQEVCPHNRHARGGADPMLAPWPSLGPWPPLLPLLRLTEDEFRHQFAHTPLLRARRGGLLRNVAVALGNLGDRVAVPPLVEALADPDPLVRSHVAWALGRLGGRRALGALETARRREPLSAVRDEIAAALQA